MKNILLALLSGFSFYSWACSPYQTPLAQHTLNTNSIDFLFTSTTNWQCCYVWGMELICDQANFTGTANFFSSDEICKGTGTGETSSWNGGNVDYAGFSIPYSDLCPGVTYKYRVRERSTIYSNWSAWSSVGTFTVPGSVPTFDISLSASPTLICAPACATLTAVPGTGCTAPTITWDQGLGTGVQHIVCPTQNTTYQVTATYIVPFCPTIVSTQSVSITADLPAVNGTVTAAPPLLCLGQSTTLTVSGHYGSLQWQSSTNLNGPFTDIPGATSSSYTYSGTTTGTIFFRVRIYTCTEEFTVPVEIKVYDIPVADFDFIDGCVNSAIDFVNLTQNEDPILTWSWDFGGGINSSLQSPSVTFSPGTYQVTLTATNEGGCSDQLTQTVIVYALPTVSFNVASVCEGETSVLNSLTTVPAPGNITSYAWDFESDGSVDYTTQNVSTTYPAPGTHSVTLTVMSNDGCSASYTGTAIVHPMPILTLDIDPEFCTYDPQIGILNISPLTSAEGTGTLSGPGILGLTFDPGDAGQGTHTITYVYTSQFGCSNTITDQVTVYSAPVVDFTADPLVGLEPLDVDFVNNSSGATNFTWNFGDGQTATGNMTQTSHTFNEFGSYVVTLIGEQNGCTDQMSITIQVNINPITYDIPNVFTPNADDNVNPFFQLINPFGFHRVEEFELLILNRWGNVIMTFENYDFGWDGKDASGNDVAEGVYFYTLKMRSMVGETFENQGFVHLIRK